MAATRSFAVALYRFGPFEADLARGELRKFGLRMKLERKPWHLLLAFLESPGHLIRREELQRTLWDGDVFVDFDHGLNVAIKKLRDTLGDSADQPKYIETVSGEGYRFIGAVEVTHSSQTPVTTQPVLTPQTVPVGRMDTPAPPVTKRKSWRLILAVTGVLAIAIAVATFALLRRQPVDNPEKVMLVVLPFKNLSGDPNQEYLSDGITEELTAQLGKLNPSKLGVIGRTSAMTYKNSPSTIRQIGKDLAVNYVLEGSVRREGNNLRVTAQLVRVSDQTHVWTESYGRDVRELLHVEEDVGSDIAQHIGVSIAPGAPKPIHPHIPNAEAHQAYLLARYHWHRRRPEDWETAEKHFRRALEHDPEYAAAYAGLAECRVPLGEARASAQKAVELDPASGEAHTALARVQLYRDLDIVTAEETLKAAIQLDPNYPLAQHTYSNLLAATGRFQEAIQIKRQAATLDPLSFVIKGSLAGLLSSAGQYDAAQEELKSLLELDPRNPLAHELSGQVFAQARMYGEAIREYQLSEENGGNTSWGALGYIYGVTGKKEDALRVLSKLKKLQERSGGVSVELAMVQSGLGNNDAALAWLERAYEEHDDGLLELKVNPMFNSLRSEPRFQELLRQMKLVL